MTDRPPARRVGSGPVSDAPATRPNEDVDAVYAGRVEAFRRRRDEEERRSARVGSGRLALFLTGILLFLSGDLVGTMLHANLLRGAALLLVFPFAALVMLHARIRRRIRRLEALARLNEEAGHRRHRRWDSLPASVPSSAPPEHPYAADLDLDGHASVVRLLGTVSTAPGRETLFRWLLEPVPLGEIPERQDAVRELGEAIDFRDGITVGGRQAAQSGPGAYGRFLDWAEDEPLLPAGWSPRGWARSLPPLTILLGLADLWGLIPFPLWALPLAAGSALALRWRRRVHAVFDRASTGEGAVRTYAELLESVAATSFESARLRELQRSCAGEDDPAARSIHALRRLLDLADARRSGMLHPFLDLVLLWDLNVLAALERWQTRDGRRVRRWLAALGEIDALGALGALHHAHPSWVFPDLRSDGPTALRATDLAHPLLSPGTAVGNEVTVGPPGTFLFVTGSNMSGKSTLLRAIGVNVVLAGMGAPVRARSLSLPEVSLWTCMRVEDSLDRGVSYFMAELERVKRVVDAARNGSQGPPVLYLLDELLQGTNTAERQIAARNILRHLLARGAIGAVTSHDLALASTPELEPRARAVHFRETVDPGDAGAPLRFDYRLRPGVATSTNALRLMELMGLGGEAAGDGHA